MKFLAGGVNRKFSHKAVIPRTLEVGDIRAVLAELVKFLGSKALVSLDHIGGYNLPANLVRSRGYDTVANLWISIQNLLNLNWIDIRSLV